MHIAIVIGMFANARSHEVITSKQFTQGGFVRQLTYLLQNLDVW